MARQMSSRWLMGVAVALIFVAAVMFVLALPGLHQPVLPRPGHYQTEARRWQAQQARQIVADSQNPCRFYECAGSANMLRVCVGATDTGEIVNALQWLWYDGKSWLEGTAFLQDKSHKVHNYLSNNGCREVAQ